ncbi:sigma-54 interaction domain protein [delta proteobacterium NaphS2]|nr:sigma-54 interaction domain protein [delta proteobacterium NaphS2]
MPRKRWVLAVSENTFFRQATLSIFSSLNIETAKKRCMNYLKEYMPISGMLFALYDPGLNLGRILASIWPPYLQEPDNTIPMPRAFWHWMKEKWTQAPGMTIINDLDKEEPPVKRVLSMFLPADSSLLIMDLELDGKRLGILCLFVEGKGRYTEFHGELISLLHEPFAIAISNILQHQEILRLRDMVSDDNRYLHRQILEMTGDTIIGADFGLKEVTEAVRQVALLNNPVLLVGETGVGKEVFANAIHYSSPRQNKPFIKVNCGAIPEGLIDSELFGHEKGAFTGAISRKRGRFERAHTGTIFLDEIGDLPLAAQVRLLRVLQQHEIERVGGTESIPVDVRIVSATHRNMEEMVRSGRFREDLWFRLNVFPITIPPLRHRKEDIPALAAHFMERKSRELKIHSLPALDRGLLDRLQAYHWPGNVRELENLVERALIQNQIAGGEGPLRLDPMPLPSFTDTDRFGVHGEDNRDILPLDQAMRNHIHKALARTGGKVEGKDGAAHILGLHPSTLRGRMKRLSIDYGKVKHDKRRRR